MPKSRKKNSARRGDSKVKDQFCLNSTREGVKGRVSAGLINLRLRRKRAWRDSHMTVRHVDLQYVRDNFWHSSISTTSGYLHSEEDARLEATQARHRIGWSSNRSLT